MELSQLYYFITVAENENITAAANIIHISQPALSKAIANLEEELGTKLFARNGNKISLNLDGKKFYRRIGSALSGIRMAVDEVAVDPEAHCGSLSIVMATPNMLQDAMMDFLCRYPKYRIQVTMQTPLQMIDSLRNQEADIAVSYSPLWSRHLQWLAVRKAEFFVLVSESHRLADRASVSLQEFREEPFALRLFDSDIGEIQRRFCHRAGIQPGVVCESNDITFILDVVRNNRAISLEAVEPRRAPQGVRSLRISDLDCCIDEGISYTDINFLSPAGVHFKDHVVEFYQNRG